MLRILGVSRSGYNSFEKRLPSDRLKKEELKTKIKQIYDESYQNYGAPKIKKFFKSKWRNYSRKNCG